MTLDHHNIQTNSEVATIIGGGPSLTDDQIEYIRLSSSDTIAVNDAYKKVPDATFFFATDIKWWYYHRKEMSSLDNGSCWTIEGVGKHFLKRYKSPKLNELSYTREYGLYNDKVHHGGNSGYIAIQFARLLGYKKIILVGFDHQHTFGKAHWFGDHDKTWFRKNAEDTERWLSNLDRLLTDINDVDIVNCSLQTAITSCRRSTLEYELL